MKRRHLKGEQGKYNVHLDFTWSFVKPHHRTLAEKVKGFRDWLKEPPIDVAPISESNNNKIEDCVTWTAHLIGRISSVGGLRPQIIRLLCSILFCYNIHTDVSTGIKCRLMALNLYLILGNAAGPDHSYRVLCVLQPNCYYTTGL